MVRSAAREAAKCARSARMTGSSMEEGAAEAGAVEEGTEAPSSTQVRRKKCVFTGAQRSRRGDGRAPYMCWEGGQHIPTRASRPTDNLSLPEDRLSHYPREEPCR